MTIRQKEHQWQDGLRMKSCFILIIVKARGFSLNCLRGENKTYLAFIIADNIDKNSSGKELVALLLHEISTHALQLGKTKEAFQSLLKRFEAMQKGNPNVSEAFARVPSDTKPLFSVFTLPH